MTTNSTSIAGVAVRPSACVSAICAAVAPPSARSARHRTAWTGCRVPGAQEKRQKREPQELCPAAAVRRFDHADRRAHRDPCGPRRNARSGGGNSPPRDRDTGRVRETRLRCEDGPAQQYAINSERRCFALLRPIVDTTAQDPVREVHGDRRPQDSSANHALRSRAKSAAVANRSSGFFDRHRKQMRSNSKGTDGLMVRSDGGLAIKT